MSGTNYYIGVDVGTGSVRSGLVQADGKLVASATKDIRTWRDPKDHRIFEQSTTDIWDAICITIRKTLLESKVSPSDVKGIGFDATCSLAVTDFDAEPIMITRGDKLGQRGEINIVLWADHRAEKEADLINSKTSLVLNYVGGTMSLEMEIPKILWLKHNMDPVLFSRCQFFDLPDFLTYRATGHSTRSLCSMTCKCSYVPDKGWQADFFDAIGLPEFTQNGFIQIGGTGNEVATAGIPIGKGLTKKAAEELGLIEGTPVGSAVIDAYAGWIGTIAARHDINGQLSKGVAFEESSHRIASVAGTSTCHIVQSREGVFVPGVWGPYKAAVFPGWWMNEGGQSSTGQLIDFMITTHTAYSKLEEVAAERKTNIHKVLHDTLEDIRKAENVESWTEVLKDMHFYPDLHGNRSPIADPRMRGSIMGLTIDSSLEDLARKYALTLEAIALQTRHILDVMNAAGHSITEIYMSGSQAQNAALMRLFANVCGATVVLPHSYSVAVVLGAAMLGRFAAEYTPGIDEKRHCDALWDIMVQMTPPGTVVRPTAPPKEKKLLNAKYKIFREAIEVQQRWRMAMEEAAL